MSQLNVVVRPALAGELSEVRRLFEAVVGPLEVYNATARQSELATYTFEYLETLQGRDPNYILVAVCDEAIVGFTIARDDEGVLWLSWYGVAPQARGQSIGAKLLGELCNTAAAMGYWKVWCDTRSENWPSIKCMTSVGFRVLVELKRHWFGQDFVLLERWLEDQRS